MKNVRFTIINADIEEVCKAIEEGMDVKEFSVLYESPLDIDLDEVAYNPPVMKCQLWTPCNSEVTACFTNLKDGWNSLFYWLRKRRNFEITHLAFSHDVPNDEDYYAFRHFHHIAEDGSERYVRVMQDPRWDFWEQGEIMPFEQIEKYSERFIRNRLTNDMLLDYALAMGWDLRSPDFWKSHGKARCYERSNRKIKIIPRTEFH